MSSIDTQALLQSLVAAITAGGNTDKVEQLKQATEMVSQSSKYKITINTIDLNGRFSLTDIRKKNEEHSYQNDGQLINDLSKVIRHIEDGKGCYVQKVYDGKIRTYKLQYITRSSMKESLQEIILAKKPKRTAYDVLLEHLSKLTIQGVRFYAPDDDNIYSLFHGYKYNIKDEYDEAVIKPFIDFIKEVICSESAESDDSNNEINI